MIKDIKFIVMIIFTGLTAYLIAILVNQVVLNKTVPYQDIVLSNKVKAQNKKIKQSKTARYVVKKNIFNSALSFDANQINNIEDNSETPEQIEQNSNGYICERSSIAIEIKSTMPAEPKEYSYFSAYDRANRKVNYYTLGDDFMEPNVTVYDIRRSVVMLDRNGKKECLFLGKNGKEKKGSYSSKPSSKTTTASNNRSGSRVDVKQTGDNAYTIDAEDLNKELKSLNRISREARGVFARDRKNPGKSLGFKLFAIKRGSLFEKIGIKNGDIIQAINGEKLDNPDRALEMYSKLQDGVSDLNVSVLRHGKKVVMDYSVK